MGYIIKYARVGNAEPVYLVTDTSEPCHKVLCHSVDEVRQMTGCPAPDVRTACAEAREEGMSAALACSPPDARKSASIFKDQSS
jgi:hypothetical protein